LGFVLELVAEGLDKEKQSIQEQINDTISQMAQAQDKSEEIKRLIRQIEFGQAVSPLLISYPASYPTAQDIDVYSKFEQSVETKIWRHDPPTIITLFAPHQGELILVLP
jgi:hypothetical protein